MNNFLLSEESKEPGFTSCSMSQAYIRLPDDYSTLLSPLNVFECPSSKSGPPILRQPNVIKTGSNSVGEFMANTDGNLRIGKDPLQFWGDISIIIAVTAYWLIFHSKPFWIETYGVGHFVELEATTCSPARFWAAVNDGTTRKLDRPRLAAVPGAKQSFLAGFLTDSRYQRRQKEASEVHPEPPRYVWGGNSAISYSESQLEGV
ncbi:hypothetical protein F5B21DRAFT_504450 [Xylaria acuta]|nr:hypothetical protein F5B21DRAFT_504450 [Xylaria acuta]